MKCLLKNLIFGTSLIFVQPAFAQIKAESFVGKWSCQPEGNVSAFEWHVHQDLKGDWLVGEGYEGKVLNSIDIWAFNQDGSFGTRRQFTPDGGFIVMNPIESTPEGLKSEGQLTQRDGSIIKLAHQVSFTSNNSFEAKWQVVEDSEVKEQIAETCTRQEN